jgi:hypothetical protein
MKHERSYRFLLRIGLLASGTLKAAMLLGAYQAVSLAWDIPR